MANLIDGKMLSLEVKDNVKEKVKNFYEKYNKQVCLAVVLVGENPASKVYVNNKIKGAEYVGIKSLSFTLPQNATQDEVENLVLGLVNNDEIDGILVQLPLPKGLDEEKILNLIPAEKDVDGFTAQNVGSLFLGKPCISACTPSGVIKMLEKTGIDLTGKNAVIIGRSNIVGKPMSALLLAKNCTVTICHSKTKNLSEICKNADVIVAAIGKAKFVTKDMVKKGAIVIDVGINRTETGLVGDVDFENVKELASFITPVPGGVGPMTIAMLMENTLICAERRINKR